MKRLLVTGSSGYLGRHLVVRAAERFRLYSACHRHPDRVQAGQPLQVDLADRAAVMSLVTGVAPQAIIHAGAINPGGPVQAMRVVNAAGSRHVAEAAVRVGARLVHLSTDVVHNGRAAPYADDAPPDPLNPYGQSKAEAEAAVAQVDPQAAIVRTSLIYGLAHMDRGTAGFVERLRHNPPLVLFNDVIRQPVWVETLVTALLKLVDMDFGGHLNVAGSQALTREAFGRRMLAWWGVQVGEAVQSGRAADISPAIPLDLRLQLGRAERLLQMTLPGVDEVLGATHN